MPEYSEEETLLRLSFEWPIEKMDKYSVLYSFRTIEEFWYFEDRVYMVYVDQLLTKRYRMLFTNVSQDQVEDMVYHTGVGPTNGWGQ